MHARWWIFPAEVNVCAGYTNHFVLCRTNRLLISRDYSLNTSWNTSRIISYFRFNDFIQWKVSISSDSSYFEDCFSAPAYFLATPTIVQLACSRQHAACCIEIVSPLCALKVTVMAHGALPFLSLVNDCPLPAPHRMQTELSHDITAMSAWYSSRLLLTGKCVILRLFVSLIFARTACARE